MRNNIKNKLMQFIWEHFHRNKPMIPKGLVDTSALNNQVIASMEELKGLLAKDPHIFRQMQLMSRYRVNFPLILTRPRLPAYTKAACVIFMAWNTTSCTVFSFHIFLRKIFASCGYCPWDVAP